MPKRLPRSRTLKGDPSLAYYDSDGGIPGEPPVLLLHGRTMRSEDWENIFPRLATRYRVIALDQRGHGKSGRAQVYTLSAFVDDALRVLREVAKAPAVLIGHSLGAIVAYVAAGRAPDLVRGLALEDPPIGEYGAQLTGPFWEGLRAALARREDPTAFARAVGRLPLPRPGPRGERTIGEMRGFYSQERIAMYYRDVDPALVEWRMSNTDSEGRALLETTRVRCPTLLLAADPKEGGFADDAAVAALSSAVTGLTVLRFPKVGHRIHGLRPEPYIDALEPFLRGIAEGKSRA